MVIIAQTTKKLELIQILKWMSHKWL